MQPILSFSLDAIYHAGFRGVGIVEQSWGKLVWKVADLNVLPHKVEILGIGIAKDEMNKTGETEWTGNTPNARADRDPVGGLADLLAHEIAINNSGLIDMIRTGHPQLWKSRMWFSKREENGVEKINSLLGQVTKQIHTWDKDKRSGLFQKCDTRNLLAAEVDSDAVNRFMNWKGDTQSRSYAKGELAAYVKQQAVLAGFESLGWRQNHHLGRATIAVDMSWCNALLPGLSDMPNNLPARFQEFHQCLTKTAVASWQNLAINTLKYGLSYVEGLPNVAKVMQTRAYQDFATVVRVAECDSMEKLYCMNVVPHLTQWKLEHVQAVETRVPGAPATMTAEVQEPPSKRQRVEATAAQTQLHGINLCLLLGLCSSCFHPLSL